MSDRLPVDLLQPILSNLDVESLKTCSVTCSTWLPWARRALFRTLVLGPKSDYTGIYNMLQRSPYLTRSVRHLTVYGPSTGIQHEQGWLVGPAPICAQLTNIESFTLKYLAFSVTHLDSAIVAAFFASLCHIRKSAVRLKLERVRVEEGRQCARIISAFPHLVDLSVKNCGLGEDVGRLANDLQALSPCVHPPSLHKLRAWYLDFFQPYLPRSITSDLRHLVTRMSDSHDLEPLLHPNAFATVEHLEYYLNMNGSSLLRVCV